MVEKVWMWESFVDGTRGVGEKQVLSQVSDADPVVTKQSRLRLSVYPVSCIV